MHNCIDSCCIYTARLSPALNESSEIQCFEHSDAIEICDGIIFDSRDCHICGLHKTDLSQLMSPSLVPRLSPKVLQATKAVRRPGNEAR